MLSFVFSKTIKLDFINSKIPEYQKYVTEMKCIDSIFYALQVT